MGLADDFQLVLDSLPDDWSDLELDVRIFEEARYVDAAVYLVVCNAQPYSRHDWHFRILCAHRFGHAAAAQAVHAALGLLDFQDALAGHPAYDLVSLLQDARRDVDPSVEEAMLRRYRKETGEGEAFLAAYHVLGAQRNAKILGIFTRLWRRDGKPRYPALCPRVWAYLERDLSQPVLAPVAAWFDDNVPPEQRGDPLILAA